MATSHSFYAVSDLPQGVSDVGEMGQHLKFRLRSREATKLGLPCMGNIREQKTMECVCFFQLRKILVCRQIFKFLTKPKC